MKVKLLVLVVLMLALVPAVTVAQQQPTSQPAFLLQETVDPNVNISWPPPVYVLRGQAQIRGSANVANMTNYFIEFRPVSEDLSLNEGAALWFPVSLPNTQAVQNDVLATWDTTEVPDGLYELRLTVNTATNQVQQAYVRLIRVENNPPPFVQQPTVAAPTIPAPTQPPLLIPTPTRPPVQATLPPPPTIIPTQDLTPRASITSQAANVRTGDSTAYPAIQSFRAGTAFTIIGVSARGTGWYLIQLPNGLTGWIAPSVVNVTGNTTGLPFVSPPPPPATATPTPIPPTPTPATSANLVAGIVELNPGNPRCNETFNVGFDVANLGTGPTTLSGVVSLQDVHGQQVTQATIGGFPSLNPGQTFRVNMPITVDTFYEEDHILVLVIDPQNLIPETNDNDNRQTLTYRLRKGNCP